MIAFTLLASVAFSAAPMFDCPAPGSGVIAGTNITWACPTAPVTPPVPPPVVQPPPATGPCDPTTKSDSVFGATLTRQCIGQITYSGSRFGKPAYVGPVYMLDAVLTDATHKGGFPAYVSGYSFTPVIQSGQFVAFQFTVAYEGQAQFTNDPSFGTAGAISVSKYPGHFSSADTLCMQNSGASNSLIISTPAAGQGDCNVRVGQPYYLNFTLQVGSNTSACFNADPNTCASSPVSYSEVAAVLR